MFRIIDLPEVAFSMSIESILLHEYSSNMLAGIKCRMRGRVTYLCPSVRGRFPVFRYASFSLSLKNISQSQIFYALLNSFNFIILKPGNPQTFSPTKRKNKTMVVRNDEPDIIIGGDPSAPPFATAVPATAVAIGNKNIERTTNADGSLTVKATATSCRSNGYRDVTIEYFYVPANMAGTVIMSMNSTGEPPSSLYLTKMEQQVFPPGTGEVMSHAPSSAPQTTTAAAASASGGNPVPQPYIHEDAVERRSGYGRGCAICCACVCIVIVAVATAIVRGVGGSNAMYPVEPEQWTPPTPNPTRAGCKDTPGWVDEYGSDCDWYDWYDASVTYTDICSALVVNQGSMGPATENCCACGGGSTYVAPMPWPSRAPIISPPPTPSPTRGQSL